MAFAKRTDAVPLCALILAACLTRVVSAQESFRYRHFADDKWHVTSTVEEEVFVNGEFFYKTEILNKISVEILEGEGEGGVIGNRYRIAEMAVDSDVYAWNGEYETRYTRDVLGRLGGLASSAAVPMVRDVPLFPEDPLQPGDSWSAPGLEVFDLDPGFGIPEIIHIPFTAEYRYTGPAARDGRNLHAISVEYGFSWNPPDEAGLRQYALYPVEIGGVFEVEVFWDAEAGRNYAEEGAFSYTYVMNDGQAYTFRGTSSGEAVYAEPMDKNALVEEIEQLSDDLGRISAEPVDEGVSVSLEDIHFVPDRAEMLPGEDRKLDRIAGLLAKYPDRDILVVGHTATVPGYGDGMRLSELRAEAVARYFINKGVREPSRVVMRGMGNTEPVGDNSTEEGRRRNRRVEIIILEN